VRAGLDEVRAAVRRLADDIHGRGLEIEQAGQLPPDVVAGLHAAGVFRLWQPAELGGYEAEPAAVVEILQTLAEADGSTAWCAATGIAGNVAGAMLPEAAARAMFDRPGVLASGVLMPGGRAVPQPGGGYLVDGRWPFGSGTQHCDWVIGGARVEGPEPAMLAVLMPAAAVKFLQTWQVIGLAGTGSVDYEASGLHVPAEHCIPLAELRPWPAGAMWRIPLRSLLYPVLAAVPLGIGRRALAELLAVSERVRFGSARQLAEQELVQAAVGRAQVLLQSGASNLTDSLQQLLRTAAAGRMPSPAERAAARAAAVYATEQAHEAITLCYQTAGTTAMYWQHPLQRAVRDVLAASQHFALSAQGLTLSGKVILGLEPDVML